MIKIKCLSNGLHSQWNSHAPFGKGFLVVLVLVVLGLTIYMPGCSRFEKDRGMKVLQAEERKRREGRECVSPACRWS